MYFLFFGCTGTLTVIFLNVLIAVISDTFDKIQERRESCWVKGQAELIAEIESIFGKQDPEDFKLLLVGLLMVRKDAIQQRRQPVGAPLS